MKSKQVLTATLVIALGAALAVNWYYKNTPELSGTYNTSEIEEVSGNLGDSLYVGGTTAQETTKSQIDSQDYFSQAKLKRTQYHDKTIDNINKIADSEKTDSETRNRLTVMVKDFRADLKSETDCENLISAKTGKECLVVINEGNCQVILEKNTLNDMLILQITEIIEKNTEISSENLTIIELK
jgi:hypothetical protein